MSTTIKQAIDGFLLSCKGGGKSYGAIECCQSANIEKESTTPLVRFVQ